MFQITIIIAIICELHIGQKQLELRSFCTPLWGALLYVLRQGGRSSWCKAADVHMIIPNSNGVADHGR